MDKIAEYNNGVKYLVGVDVSSRFLRVEPLKTGTAPDTTRAFKRMTTKIFSEDVCSDKETLKESLNNFVIPKMSSSKIHTVKRSLLLPSEIVDNWKSSFINIWRRNDPIYISISFMTFLNSLDSRMTGVAPMKVTTRHESQLVSLVSNRSTKHVKKPKFKPGDFLRVSKEILPFKKGYQQNFTTKSLKKNYKSESSNVHFERFQEKLPGKFYQP